MGGPPPSHISTPKAVRERERERAKENALEGSFTKKKQIKWSNFKNYHKSIHPKILSIIERKETKISYKNK